MKHLFIFICLASFWGCGSKNNDPDPSEVLNESDRYIVCNNIVKDCSNDNGSYCLNGYKWGNLNPLTNVGEVPGPQEEGGLITYSFQEQNGLVNTHAQINLPSKSFSNLPLCIKDQLRKGFETWSSVANISFEEQQDNSDSDIRIFVADIRQSGIGYPNFPNSQCTSLAGTLIIQTDLWTSDCDEIYKFVLHEIGHVLGLGHVGTNNIMSPSFETFNALDGLQNGDIEGITQLYGPR